MQMTSTSTLLSTISIGIMKDSLKVLVLKKANARLSRNDKTIFQTYIFCDEQGKEIQGICYENDVEKFDSTLREGAIYYISNVVVSIIDPQYRITSNDKQIKLTSKTEVIKATDDTSINLPQMSYTKIGDLSSLKPLTISFWDNFAKIQASEIAKLLNKKMPVILATRLRRTTYRDFSLSTTSTSTILINPTTLRSEELQIWYVFHYLYEFASKNNF
ncbi:hypothetical protein AXF42_Ash010211 [Apostasia shenzhenica]|uniref:Replication protein A 70 kDa DNA-binding subunit B/D first OB fold domain-containing protein n=1 Tax=Apostasia shenzhenica TaxID=1088818 RepID=A0A2I0A9W6_9ASPA|nr:hypothetical protein AXF42_Ash010211 [Apostasia shenzhenica]